MDYDFESFKLSTKFFSNRKIQLIEDSEIGDSAIVIWIKMLALAGQYNGNGALYITNNVPYTPDDLSTLFRKPVDLIVKALYLFEKYSMILVSENGVITIKNWEKYQNPEDDECEDEECEEETEDDEESYAERKRQLAAERKRRQRARERSDCEACHANVTQESVTCHADVTQNGFFPPTPPYIYNNISSLSQEEAKKPRKVFVKPTVEEVDAYCSERKNGIKGASFIDYYDSVGWVVGAAKKPMKDWKAAVRQWERKEQEKDVNGYGQNNRDHGKTDAGPRTKYDLKVKFAGHKYDADGNDITGT